MTTPKYPNESEAYRQARDALLEEEKALISQVKAVAAKRRELPPGGTVSQDYAFVGASDATLGKPVRFSELFGDKNTLLLYAFMYGPGWDHPCQSCTSLVDGFDRASISVNHDAAIAVVAKASADDLNAWAHERGWRHIPLVSAGDSDYLRDYQCESEEGKLWPIMHVFTKRAGEIRHFWASEMSGNHVDMVWPYWNLMDMTPEGRPDVMAAPQNFRSRHVEENYL